MKTKKISFTKEDGWIQAKLDNEIDAAIKFSNGGGFPFEVYIGDGTPGVEDRGHPFNPTEKDELSQDRFDAGVRYWFYNPNQGLSCTAIITG